MRGGLWAMSERAVELFLSAWGTLGEVCRQRRRVGEKNLRRTSPLISRLTSPTDLNLDLHAASDERTGTNWLNKWMVWPASGASGEVRRPHHSTLASGLFCFCFGEEVVLVKLSSAIWMVVLFW